ncbi:MAG TPA: carbohydrate ABC transporter permease [Treponema sp.]|nr:MAG: ABC transporter permease [Treponema sp. GWC1_61_84]OHE70641.1 MAG: ABC transporter permease [Treponema sp. RIFOXYC1_FULL_61_9]HCM25540.1 carbohydrate ABC transporter permease [Treponema sp.]
MKVRRTPFDVVYQTTVEVFMVFIFLVVAIPLWRIIMQSVTPIDFAGTNLQALALSPLKWSFKAYEQMLSHPSFIRAAANSTKIVAGGVVTSLALTIPLAYVLAAKTLPGRKILSTFILIPFLFNPGLIPNYLVITGLGLADKLAAVFLPGAISVYNTFVMKSFFQGIPEELRESARIDGASEITVLFRIILPLSKPILLTIGLFYGVHFWNDFFSALLYLNSSSLTPLPILLRNILMAASMNEYVEANAFSEASILSIKAAGVILASLPMVVAYPFIQKYFTKGTLLGGVKG